MRKNSKLSDVLHVLLHLADQSEPIPSESLAAMMSSNAVVVRRILGGLRERGLVSSSKGRTGGWTLTCDLSTITLLDVFRAVGEPALFAIGSRKESSDCLVETAVNRALDDALSRAESLLLNRFEAVTLQTLYADFSKDLETVRRSLDTTQGTAKMKSQRAGR